MNTGMGQCDCRSGGFYSMTGFCAVCGRDISTPHYREIERPNKRDNICDIEW